MQSNCNSLQYLLLSAKDIGTKESACLEWPYFVNKKGYGALGVGRQAWLSHRVSWLAYGGGLVPQGMMLCHHCDNPKCYRVGHLFVGTAQDNQDDYVQKGYRGKQCRLTDEKVLAIKFLLRQKVSQYLIAQKFGVNQATVSKIKTGKCWSYL